MASPSDAGAWDDLALSQNVPVVNILSFMYELKLSWQIKVLRTSREIFHVNVEIEADISEISSICIMQGQLYLARESFSTCFALSLIPAWTILPPTAQYHMLKHNLQFQLNGVRGQVGVTVVLRVVWENEFV